MLNQIKYYLHLFLIATLLFLHFSCNHAKQSYCACAPSKYTDMFPSTDEYTVHFELKEAIECAKKCGKPLFIQFTGHDVKIDETDELIINSTAIREKLYRDFIWLQMYLDDKRDADPEDYVLT